MIPLLEIQDLRVSYHTYAGEVEAVRGVSLTISPGESVAVVGESGCGKSVLAKAVMGLIAVPSGEIKPGGRIRFEGRDVLAQSPKAWRGYRGKEVSLVFQDALAALNPTLTVGRQIAEKLRVHDKKISRAEAYREAGRLLALVGIPDPERRLGQYPHELSGGQRQRVMIAVALACEPKLLIADEPTTALDVTLQADIVDCLKNLQKELGMAVVMITHDLGLVAGMARRIAVMYAGRIAETGSLQDIFYRPRHPYTQALLEAVPRLDAGSRRELRSIEGSPPSMIRPPEGCAFGAGCGFCMKICRRMPPPRYAFEEGHTAECWLYHPLAEARNDKELKR